MEGSQVSQTRPEPVTFPTYTMGGRASQQWRPAWPGRHPQPLWDTRPGLASRATLSLAVSPLGTAALASRAPKGQPLSLQHRVTVAQGLRGPSQSIAAGGLEQELCPPSTGGHLALAARLW